MTSAVAENKRKGAYQTKTATQLFLELHNHFMQDSRPSIFLETLPGRDAYAQAPFPQLFALRFVEQSPRYHPEGNVWNHTVIVVDEAAKRREISHDPDVLMWAALLHDIGKKTTTAVRNGKITAYRHDEVGAELAEAFLVRLTDDSAFTAKVASLVRYHMHPFYLEKSLPFADIGGMLRKTDLHEVALLGICDRQGRTRSTGNDAEQIERFIKQCDQRNEKTRQEKSPDRLFGGG